MGVPEEMCYLLNKELMDKEHEKTMKKIKKVLFVSHGFPCFMSDILFHGLKVLGYDVTEYPQGTHYYGSGSTFGGRKDIGKNDFLSFCYFNFPKVHKTDKEILNNDYDAVILTSWIPEKPWILENIYNRFKGKIPIAFVDGEDDTVIRQDDFYNDVYFKRELNLPTCDYKKNIKPITFGIIDKGDNDLKFQRNWLLSFIASGHSPASLRCEMFKNLKNHPEKTRMFYSDVERNNKGMLSYEAYSNILKSSQIGISISGEGYDTYRYWEVPYYGALLMADTPKIHIENNFTDMKNAVFFDDLTEFEHKLTFLKNNFDAMRDIANAGHKHLMKYHTSKNRAEYVISELEKLK